MGVDLDDTSGCPVAARCQGCRRVGVAWRVFTADTPVGVLCVTLCDDCVRDDRPIAGMSVATAVVAVMAHCEHLGITGDEMAELTAREEADQCPR